jgi:hypothetical protein
MPKTKSVAGKKKKVAAQQEVSPEPRRLHLPKRVWYKPLTWRFSPPVPTYKPLSKARVLFVYVLRQMWRNKKLFGGIVAVYGVLNLLLVRSISGSSDLTMFKTTLDSALHGFGGKIATSVASFSYLVATSGSGSAQISGVYQYLLLLICSLAFIWALRQVLAQRKVRVRDAFYSGMSPLIPFVFVVFIIGIQLLPLVMSSALYSLVVANGIAVGWWERLLFLVVLLAAAIWSLRMITSSVFAAYAVTLPGMTPLRAIREAKKLVYGRRLLLWRKLLFLPIVITVLAILIEIPFILFLTPLAPWLFFVISMLALPITHGYMYTLYREML